MTIQSLEQMLDRVEHMIHDQINAIGKVPPIVIAQKDDGQIIMIPYQARPTAIQRRIHALALGNHFREWGVVSYVVAHEVGHLAEANHSPAFWKVVDGLTAYAGPGRRWLRLNGGALFRYG